MASDKRQYLSYQTEVISPVFLLVILYIRRFWTETKNKAQVKASRYHSQVSYLYGTIERTWFLSISPSSSSFSPCS